MRSSYVITDIGSTTTKGIVVRYADNKWQLSALANTPTTVEKPLEDVMAGVVTVLEQLQTQTGETYLDTDAKTGRKTIRKEVNWLSTSSAGGGLQILVIGLTVEESAASAQRAAYGMGGVILDTVAIDDGRSPIEQMHAIEAKQPDIILMSGGYDGGAFSSVLRLAELLSYCEIKPKYSTGNKIPLIYAGNCDARDNIKAILQDSFELHLLDNLLPAEEMEHTAHVSQKIHELFLNKVMQQAPGYAAASEQVCDPIIPTPAGMMAALRLLSEQERKNILAVDIGGATTDVYSNVFGNYQRTVSANYGMSYNLCNVFAQADKRQLNQWLAPQVTEDELRNYVGNKMLNPTHLPADDLALHLEQALAKLAMQLSLMQHLQMNYSISRLGHFLKMKSDDLDPFHEQFYHDELDKERSFQLSDFDLIIGAGGVISHAPGEKQAAVMIVDGLQPRGFTEIWRDRHFISPHLGKLSELDPAAASQLLKKDCLQPLCLCIRPLPDKLRNGRETLGIRIKSATGEKHLVINGNDLLWIDNAEPLELTVTGRHGVQLDAKKEEHILTTSLPIMIDTRISGQFSFAQLNKALDLFKLEDSPTLSGMFIPRLSEPVWQEGTRRRIFSLPYAGKIYVSPGDKVTAGDDLGENLYDPPRIYILQIFKGHEHILEADKFRNQLLVRTGDAVANGQLIYKDNQSFLAGLISSGDQHFNYYSPVRGSVEYIDYTNASLLVREIQDYSFEPMVISITDKLGIKPSEIRGYLKKRLGDFITSGEILAVKNYEKQDHILHAPATGTLTNVDTKKGTVTIQYKKKDLKLISPLQGTVTGIEHARHVELEYQGRALPASIGFGQTAFGQLVVLPSMDENKLKPDSIVALSYTPDMATLDILVRHQVRGLIVPSLPQKLVVELLGFELGVGITGGEHLPLSLLLLNGFGESPMPEDVVNRLKQQEGRQAAILPDTQIRAGVVRPELIIQ